MYPAIKRLHLDFHGENHAPIAGVQLNALIHGKLVKVDVGLLCACAKNNHLQKEFHKHAVMPNKPELIPNWLMGPANSDGAIHPRGELVPLTKRNTLGMFPPTIANE